MARPPRVFINSRRVSNGAKRLAETGGYSRFRRSGSRWRPDAGRDFLIQWGSGSVPFLNRRANCGAGNATLNLAAGRGSNKTEDFRALLAVNCPIPDFTTDRGEADRWVREGTSIMVRRLTKASSGRGCEYLAAGEAGETQGPDTEDEESRAEGRWVVPQAPLYTKYFKGFDEFRVHVMLGEVIDVQKKRKRTETMDTHDNYVRSFDNGWVFCRNNVAISDQIRDSCILAVRSLGLDFGAVDVKFNRHYGTHVVLEVNTAPGLEGQTVHSYVQRINQWVEESM